MIISTEWCKNYIVELDKFINKSIKWIVIEQVAWNKPSLLLKIQK